MQHRAFSLLGKQGGGRSRPLVPLRQGILTDPGSFDVPPSLWGGFILRVPSGLPRKTSRNCPTTHPTCKALGITVSEKATLQASYVQDTKHTGRWKGCIHNGKMFVSLP